MRRIFIYILISIVSILSGLTGNAIGQQRYLVLNFDCRGEAAGESGKIGEALRAEISRIGGRLVSRDKFLREINNSRLNESDLNYTIDKLKSILPNVGADCATYGQIYTTENLYIIELKFLPIDSEPILFDPIICGSKDDIFDVIPDVARMIISPDKTPPHVVSVTPSDHSENVNQLVDMKIVFSEPMNPRTISISAKPERMWQRYGDIVYDESENCFNVKFQLYPGLDYTFSINGEDSRGFKDIAGNPSREYIWEFKTAP